MIWKISDVLVDECYMLHLIQTKGGNRLFRLVANNSPDEHNPAQDVVLVTQIVPTELLKKRDLLAIANQVPLSDGGAFFVDAHGVWYTEQEMSALSSGQPISKIEWSTGVMPKFPSR